MTGLTALPQLRHRVARTFSRVLRAGASGVPRYFAWAVAAAAAVTLALRWLCLARLGGLTSDCLDAAIEVSELAFLLTLALVP